MAVTKKNKKHKQQNVRGSLALAVCSLLSQPASAESFDNDWTLDTSYLAYQETDRISVNKFIGNVSGNLTDTDHIQLMLVFDSMTGSTPTGGIKGTSSVTVTGASGGGFSAGGSRSGLATFDDTRLAFDLKWTRAMSRDLRIKYGASVSVENDYNSFGASAAMEKDFGENRLTTFTAGLSFTNDRISRIGGQTPDPLSQVTQNSLFDAGERTSSDLILGITRILSPTTILQFNTTFSASNGYHTDPYKIVSVVNRNSVGTPTLAEDDQLFESRPAERRRNAIYSKLIHQFLNGDNLHLALRYYGDDWEVKSGTLDLHYRYKFSNERHFIEPHLRSYSQTKSMFYSHYLIDGEPLPEFVSADNRLAEMQASTIGILYSTPFANNTNLRVRLEFIQQTFTDTVFEANEALALQVSYKMDFK